MDSHELIWFLTMRTCSQQDRREHSVSIQFPKYFKGLNTGSMRRFYAGASAAAVVLGMVLFAGSAQGQATFTRGGLPCRANGQSVNCGNVLPGGTGTIIDPTIIDAAAYPLPSVWARQVAITPTLAGESTAVQEPTVIYEATGCTLVANPCFKMWYTGGLSPQNIYYAESPDGISWTKRSTAVLNGHRGSYLLKNGSTYYLYACSGTTQIDLYTASDGITFTLDTAGTMTATGIEINFGNLAVIIDGSTWRMAYEGHWTGTAGWSMGAASSTDGRTWTRDVGNPLITFGGQGPALYKALNGTFWMWAHCCGGLPSDGVRYSSPDFHTWIRNPPGINPQPNQSDGATLPRITADEGVGLSTGQVADQSLVQINGKVYDYYTASADGTTNFKIKVAIANLTLEQLITTSETSYVSSSSVVIAPRTDSATAVQTTKADRETPIFTIDTLNGNAILSAGFGNSTFPKLFFSPNTNTGTPVTNNYLGCGWTLTGCFMRLPRTLTGHGFHVQDNSGTDIFFVDSVAGGVTLSTQGSNGTAAAYNFNPPGANANIKLSCDWRECYWRTAFDGAGHGFHFQTNAGADIGYLDTGTGVWKVGGYATTTNCSSSASPAVCGSAAAGSIAVPVGTNQTLQVNTSAVTANSQFFFQADSSLGAKLGITCNTTPATEALPIVVTTRSAGVSFTVLLTGTSATNQPCYSYFIVN
jgi:hypothetical protein